MNRTLKNFNNNLKKMVDDVDEFYEKYKNTIIKSEVGLFIPSSSNFNASLNSEDQLEYLLFSNDILNNIEYFINDLSLNCSNGMKEKIRSYYSTSILSAYKEEQKEELKTIELLKISLDNYINYSPTFPSEENYKISYKASKVSSSEKKSLLELYDLNNHGGKDLYNKKVILL